MVHFEREVTERRHDPVVLGLEGPRPLARVGRQGDLHHSVIMSGRADRASRGERVMSDNQTERVVAVHRSAERSDQAARGRGEAHRALEPWIGRTGLVRGYVLIETIGRRTGKRRRTVVGMHLERSTGWIVAEHGSHAGYVRNLTTNPTVRVCVRGTWRTAHSEVLPEDDPEERLAGFGRSIPCLHRSSVWYRPAGRRCG